MCGLMFFSRWGNLPSSSVTHTLCLFPASNSDLLSPSAYLLSSRNIVLLHVLLHVLLLLLLRTRTQQLNTHVRVPPHDDDGDIDDHCPCCWNGWNGNTRAARTTLLRQ